MGNRIASSCLKPSGRLPPTEDTSSKSVSTDFYLYFCHACVKFDANVYIDLICSIWPFYTSIMVIVDRCAANQEQLELDMEYVVFTHIYPGCS